MINKKINSMQITLVIGYLGKDASVNRFNDGNQVINFSVAETVKFDRSDKDTGEITEAKETTWYDCSYYRNADASVKIAKYLKKGTLVSVTGRVSATLYKGKNGSMVPNLKLFVSKVELLAGPKPPQQGTSASTKAPEIVSSTSTTILEDVPF